jgi:prevent-host-death family protein
MTTVKVSEARDRLADVLERARTEPVVLERHGRPAAVLVSPAMYERFVEALEELEDLASFDAALTEAGANIPWDRVKADLGWD